MDEQTNSTNSFTRGSQIFMHTLRMMMQGAKISYLISSIFAVLWFLLRCMQKIYLKDFYYLLVERWASIKLELLSFCYKPEEIKITVYDFLIKKIKIIGAIEYKIRIWNSPTGQRLTSLCSWIIHNSIFEIFVIFTFGMILTYLFFMFRGLKSIGKEKIRGGELITPKELKKSLIKNNMDSDLNIAGLPLVKNSERQHLLITGTTGTGKTNLIHEIIPQLKKKGERGIIVDVNGSFISAYFNQEHDLLLNPFDKRSVHWLPWADCQETYDYDALARALIGDPSLQEAFWDNSAEKILSEALKSFRNDQSIEILLNLLNQAPLKLYSKFFENTPVASLTAVDGDKTITSIRATLNNKTKPLTCLQETTEPFSLKKFVNSDFKGWLYISAMPIQRRSLGPLLSAWIEIILNSLMTRDPIKTNHNFWMIIDELPALGKIPSLKTALAESRKYGGCLIAGIQNIHQLRNIYGRNEAQDILDQFNSRFIFRVGDQETAQIAANILGEQETKQFQESLSYGANSIRDGVNINTIERKSMLVLPTEIMNLANLSCYVKLAGNWPITRIKLEYQARKSIAEIFEKK